MSAWWFFVEKLQRFFLGSIVDNEPLKETEETVELYQCMMCETLFTDKESYLMHFRMDTCNVNQEVLPNDKLEIRTGYD
jgi:hypothetical protein